MAQPHAATTPLPAWATFPTDHTPDPNFFAFLEGMVAHGDDDASAMANRHLADYLAPSASASPVLSSDPVSADTVASPTPAATRPRTPSSGKRTGARRTSAVHKLARCRPPASKRVHRPITNDTYLRRLHLSPLQAVTLFPPLSLELQHAASTGTSKRRGDTTRLVREFELVGGDGTRWPATCECTVAHGKLHCRLVGGWSRFCRANGVRVKDTVVLERSGGDLLVDVERA